MFVSDKGLALGLGFGSVLSVLEVGNLQDSFCGVKKSSPDLIFLARNQRI